MKAVRIILLFLIFTGGFHIQIYGETSNTETRLHKNSNNIKRPKAPDLQVIYCMYVGETLTISFTYPDGVCSCQITDRGTGQSSYYYINSTEGAIELEIGHLTAFDITITTESNKSYFGTIITH